jgi:hypothetical protein
MASSLPVARVDAHHLVQGNGSRVHVEHISGLSGAICVVASPLRKRFLIFLSRALAHSHENRAFLPQRTQKLRRMRRKRFP